MQSPLEIVIEGPPDAPLLVLRGEIDLTSVVGLRTAVAELPTQLPDRVAVDMSGVTFMDSTGLGWLAALARTGCAVHLLGTPDPIRKVLEITGVDAIVTLVDPPPDDPEP